MNVRYSVIVPVFNEEASAVPLCAQIKRVMDGAAPGDYEMIFVDDGSTDATLAGLDGAREGMKELRVLALERNYGQSCALQAGIDASSGRVIIVMDGDQEDDPRDIPKLLRKLGEGYDMVYGWRKLRRHGGAARMIASRVANGARRFLCGETVHDVGCGLKAFTRDSVSGIHLDGCKHRFLTALVSRRRVRIGEVKVHSRSRLSGRSKYGIVDRVLTSSLEMARIFILGDRGRPGSYRIQSRTGGGRDGG